MMMMMMMMMMIIIIIIIIITEVNATVGCATSLEKFYVLLPYVFTLKDRFSTVRPTAGNFYQTTRQHVP